jgi:tetratricopeptide (TPR) repeat protein
MSVKIFLSTVSDEFRTYRDQLRTDLTRHNVEVKVQEDFVDLGGDTLDKLDVYIAHCDAVVHLVGHMTGSEPGEHALGALRAKYPDLTDKLPPLRDALANRPPVSYTQWEAWLAIYHRRLLFIAEAADSAPRGPKYAATEASSAAQAKHLARLKAVDRYPGCTFTSPDNLAKQILSSAVLDLLVNAQVLVGLKPEQLKQLTEAAVRGATGPLLDRITEISKTLGVTENAAKTLLKIVGQDSNIVQDNLVEALTKVAGDYKRLQAQVAALNLENPAARAMVEQAWLEIEAGDFARAEELFQQATQAQITAAQEARNLREQACAAEDVQMLGAAGSTAAQANVALTELRYSQAAELFGQAAVYVPTGHTGERGAYLTRKADALARQGNERGDNAALRSSIEAYGLALAEYPRSQTPLDWAMTQANLGNVLSTLGERETGTALLEEAAAAHRAALTELTRERAPRAWAATQTNLGGTLARLGEREGGTERLEQAVTAHRLALEELTRERNPLEWAAAQNNLGNALAMVGGRQSGTERLIDAVTAFRAALEENTRDRVPLEWAATQTNLGNALRAIGERESGTRRLEEAVAAYRSALEERTRERIPLAWALTQNNLGNALSTIGQRESSSERLFEAAGAYRAALEERTRKRVPLDWATTQNNLGNTLTMLGQRESGTVRLKEGVTAFRAALEERTRERLPLEWAGTQNNLGNALRLLGERESGTARLVEAVSAFREALKEWTRERVPLRWAATQSNLGHALWTLGERESGTARLEEAVAAYCAALKERTRERVPLDWATSFGGQGVALIMIADRCHDAALAESALGQIQSASDTFRSLGHEQGSSYFEGQLADARVIRDRLKK